MMDSSSKPSQSVFGAAPSIRRMDEINKLTKEKKTLFRGAKFWYFFRTYYWYVFPVLVLVFLIVASAGWTTIEGNLVLGAILSLISGISVLASYIMIIPWRKHPSSLILYRSLTSVVFSVNIILNAISATTNTCRNYAVVTQLMLLSGEGWLTTIALDLVSSLTNPFASYKANMRRYQIMVWGFTGFIAFVFYFDNTCQGRFDQGVCWINVTSPSSSCLWGYYLFWVICMYLYQIWASIFAYFRLRRGLPLTFEIRKKCAMETFKCLMSYALYLSVVMIFFVIVSSNPNAPPDSAMQKFARFLLFVIANKGSVDGAVWFMLHDFSRDETPRIDDTVHLFTKLEDNEKIADPEPEDIHEEGSELTKPLDIKDITKNVNETITELADLAIAEFDEADLSPQVNMALRQQIVQYVTTGVRDAVRQSNMSKPQPNFLVNIFGSSMKRKDPAVVDGLPVMEFVLDGEHPFKAFAPEMFRELRQNEGIDDDHFLRVLSSTANERLSEGASGAFMFFCGGGEFIVKTIRGREARVLHSSLRTYYEYLRNYKDSLLCRFLGSYSLVMYSQTFYFVVMKNCFDPSAKINERFDIKGSWVGRSADPVKPSKKVVCRHCNSYFVPARREPCSVVVGHHEANVVLKDNDLRTKISLPGTDATKVVQILKRDSSLLGQLGVLDYSLLVGVRKWKFAVDVSDEELGLKISMGSQRTREDGDSTFKAASVTGPALYYLGIVDFLQDWTFNKKVERALKIYVARKDADGLSVNHPEPYMLRFQAKMDQIFDISDDRVRESDVDDTCHKYRNGRAYSLGGADGMSTDPVGHHKGGDSNVDSSLCATEVEVMNPLLPFQSFDNRHSTKGKNESFSKHKSPPTVGDTGATADVGDLSHSFAVPSSPVTLLSSRSEFGRR